MASEPVEQFHTNGSLHARGAMEGDQPDGYWEWFRLDGTRMRSGWFAHGKQTGEWTTYARDGRIVRVTML